jgi:hypothetical protein
MTRYNVNGTASHVLDFIPQGSLSVDNMFAAVTSAIQIGEAPTTSACGDLLADLADLPLFINDVDHLTNETGVYSDDDDRDGQTLHLTSGNENLPRGVALIVNVGQSGHAIVTRDPPGNEPVSFIQRLDDTHLLFVLQDPLERTQEVTIELF